MSEKGYRICVRLTAGLILNPLILWATWNGFAVPFFGLRRLSFFWETYLLELLIGALLYSVNSNLSWIRDSLEEK